MKLQKILLAVRAVVIAAATVAFYLTPQPFIPEDAEIVYVNIRVDREISVTEWDFVDMNGTFEQEEAEQILRKYTRGRLPGAPGGGRRTEGAIWLDVQICERGHYYYLHTILGEDNGRSNSVKLGKDGIRVRVNDADALLAELTALLPR